MKDLVVYDSGCGSNIFNLLDGLQTFNLYQNQPSTPLVMAWLPYHTILAQSI